MKSERTASRVGAWPNIATGDAGRNKGNAEEAELRRTAPHEEPRTASSVLVTQGTGRHTVTECATALRACHTNAHSQHELRSTTAHGETAQKTSDNKGEHSRAPSIWDFMKRATEYSDTTSTEETSAPRRADARSESKAHGDGGKKPANPAKRTQG